MAPAREMGHRRHKGVTGATVIEEKTGNRPATTLAVLTLAIGLAACDDPGEYLPPAPPVSRLNAQSVDDPENTIVVIYNHDSTPEAEKDLCQPRGSTTPEVIKALAGKKARDKTIAVFAFCTPTETGDFDDEYSEGEPKVVEAPPRTSSS